MMCVMLKVLSAKTDSRILLVSHQVRPEVQVLVGSSQFITAKIFTYFCFGNSKEYLVLCAFSFSLTTTNLAIMYMMITARPRGALSLGFIPELCSVHFVFFSISCLKGFFLQKQDRLLVVYLKRFN